MSGLSLKQNEFAKFNLDYDIYPFQSQQSKLEEHRIRYKCRFYLSLHNGDYGIVTLSHIYFQRFISTF